MTRSTARCSKPTARSFASPRPARRNERALILDHYDWSGGREAMLRIGPDTGPVVVVALPLFEEANRVRAFAVTICQALAKRGVASVLPDVPGQGESLTRTDAVGLADLRTGFSAAMETVHHEKRHAYSAAIRSGAILTADGKAYGEWSFSPVSGASLIAELGKVLVAAGRNPDAHKLRTIDQCDETDTALEIAGNLIGSPLLQELTYHREAFPIAGKGVPIRVLRLETDRTEATRHVPGTPLWRRAEPDNDPALATLLADDIADWIASCEG